MSSTKSLTEKQRGQPNPQSLPPRHAKRPSDGSVQSDTNQKNQRAKKDQMNSPRGKVPSR
jgi:hypothetical protein